MSTKLYVLIGPPGSGKSNFAPALNAKIVSYSDTAKKISKNGKVTEEKVLKEAYSEIIRLLNLGEKVVFDAMNTNEHARKQLLDMVPDNVLTTAMIFTTPLDECLRNNAAKIEKSSEKEIIEYFANENRKAPVKGNGGFNRVFCVGCYL